MSNESEYNDRFEWRDANPKDYSYAYRQGFLPQICEYYGWKYNKPSKYWTKELCIEEARKHTKKSFWWRDCSTSYTTAKKNGWMSECTKHMSPYILPIGKWTKELCIEEARKHKYMGDWIKNSGGSYQKAKRNGWVDECTKHMK